MAKKLLNQNAKFVDFLVNTVEPDFNFVSKPINRFKSKENKENLSKQNKLEQLINLKKKINSIENCNLKEHAKNTIIGDGNINSPLMLIGETPGELEDSLGSTFQGEVGELLKKMLLAINIKIDDVYSAYSISYRPPEDRKPTSLEIKRYSIFLKEHISIIDPKIIILMGGTAMESLIGHKNKISEERGKWKEIILGNKTYPFIITYNPSYLIRYPENKKYSWDDLKKIKQKIQYLNIKI